VEGYSPPPVGDLGQVPRITVHSVGDLETPVGKEDEVRILSVRTISGCNRYQMMGH